MKNVDEKQYRSWTDCETESRGSAREVTRGIKAESARFGKVHNRSQYTADNEAHYPLCRKRELLKTYHINNTISAMFTDSHSLFFQCECCIFISEAGT